MKVVSDATTESDESAWLREVLRHAPPLTTSQLDLIRRVYRRPETPDAIPASDAA